MLSNYVDSKFQCATSGIVRGYYGGFVATGAISFTLKQYQLIQVSNYVAAMCDVATMHLNGGALTF